MATLSDLTTQVRRLIGNPSTTEFSDADLQGLLTIEALAWLNRRRPGKTLSSFTTVNEQQDYDEKPAAAYRVTEVFWMGGGYDLFSPSMRYLPSSMDVDDRIAGFNAVENPALIQVLYKHIEQYKRNFAGKGWETENGLIRLEPRPGETGDYVYYFYTHAQFAAVTDVGAEFVEGLKKMAAVMCLDYLFIKRGVVRSGKQFVGGGGANEDIVRKQYFDEAGSAIPALVNPFYHG